MVKKFLLSSLLLVIVGSISFVRIAAAYDVGGHAVETYNCGTSCDTSSAVDAVDNTGNFVDELVNTLGYNNIYERYNCSAEENDFVGADSNYVDNVDIAYFCGHGDVNGIKFGTENSYCTCPLSRMELGDGDLAWLILDSCQVLNYTYIVYQSHWPNSTFKGLHMIFGHDTEASASAYRGRKFARYADGYYGTADKLVTASINWLINYRIKTNQGG
ncbi:MAG: DUF6345 domain-containing protein [bacterium]